MKSILQCFCKDIEDIFMKEKVFTRLLAITLFYMVSFSGCSFENGINYAGKGSDTQIIERKDILIDEKNNLFHLGDEVEEHLMKHETNAEYVANRYRVNSAKLYDSASDVDDVKGKLLDVDCYLKLDPEKPKFFHGEELASRRFLYCDLTIYNENDDDCNISGLSLVYEQDGVCQMVGSPAYFSASKDSEQDVYAYTLLPGQSLDVQIGWCVDPDLLQIRDFDSSHLYLQIPSIEEIGNQFIDLGLE